MKTVNVLIRVKIYRCFKKKAYATLVIKSSVGCLLFVNIPVFLNTNIHGFQAPQSKKSSKATIFIQVVIDGSCKDG
jgi:hypothetical protein